MRFFKKRNIIIAIILLIIITAVIFSQTSSKPKEISTASVTKGDLLQTIEPTGSIKSQTEIKLNFDTIGRISKIYVKVGDHVKAGQLLANLDSRNLDSAVEQARADLSKARGNLDAYLAGSTPEVIAQYEADVQKAEANLEKAKVDLDNLKASLEQNYKNAYANQLTNLQGSLTPLETSMTDMDTILGLENTYANDSLDKAITNLDNSSFHYANASKSFRTARNLISDFKTSVVNLDKNSDFILIDASSAKAKSALDAVGTALNDTWTVLDRIDVSNPNNEVTITTINSKKTIIDTDRAAITIKKGVVLSGEQAIGTAKLNYGLGSGSVAASQVAQYEANIKIYEAALISAQAALEAKKAPPRAVDRASYDAAVKAAEANLLNAEANRSKAFIYAPVDGIVTQKNNEVGETSSSGGAVLVMLADTNYEIEVNVSESDIAKVKLGQIADVTLDAFGENYIFKGKVTNIDPAETLISDVVYYKVKISLDKELSLSAGRGITQDYLDGIKAGMTANVTVLTNRKDDVLIIPERAIVEKDGKQVVRVLIDKKTQKIEEKEVSTGLRGNEGMIEIVSGLEPGQEVITFIKNGI